jgi:alginate O-acetyltransferase complex protein AlgJ
MIRKIFHNIVLGKRYLFSIFFFSILLAPSIGYVVGGHSGEFAENFFGKEKMIYYLNNTLYRVFQNRVFPGLINAGDGWLVYTGELSSDDYQNAYPFTAEELDAMGAKLELLCDFLTRQGSEFIFVVPPNKNTIYPEYVPASIPLMNTTSRLDQIAGIWKDTAHCKLIDLRQEFKLARQNTRIYHATDTHWNSIGAFFGYQSISRFLQGKFPAVHTHGMEDFSLSSTVFDTGDLTSKHFGQIQETEITPLLVPNYQSNYQSHSDDNAYGISKTVSSANNDLPTALVYRDSFYEALFPLLAEDFSRAQYLWITRVDVDLDLIKARAPDVFILEVTERYLHLLLKNLPEPSKY